MNDVTVSVSHGALRGRESGGVLAFLGIPYAAPPFGRLRMRPPQPPASWGGLRDATVYGASAPQPGYGPAMAGLLEEAGPQGEDCLNLNVWTPAAPGRAGERLPVMVFVHGGAFRNGAGSLALYDGSRLAADGVVCVTLNYRLGAEGFLLLPDGTANLGLLDQIAALRWVRDNIAAFGGDPDNVTVFGQSAGAISVTALMTMPGARGLFRRAITQSGAGHHVHTPGIGRLITERIAALAGVPCTRAALAATPPDVLVAADTALGQEIARSREPRLWGESAGGGTTVLPVVDGVTLPSRPVDAIAAGAGTEVDLLTGTTSDEFRLFAVPMGIVHRMDDTVVKGFLTGIGLPAERAHALYTLAAGPNATPGDVFSAVMTDHSYRIPAIRVAESRARHDAHTYVYEFARASTAADGTLGACHMAELPFVFGTLDTSPADRRPDAQDLSDQVRAAWVSFARDGRPTPPRGARAWRPYATDRTVLRIGAGTATEVHDPAAERRHLWEGRR
ncbi:carboxylesterase/lipase family protein [Streptomyces griseomycini]|uniref:Carboxylic ester hydrolase n=1 Tax=Streptomyces griseomycini TaxID=66895 RepID=A0A7W7PTZ2_9ACTN|nr:carboxylesterase family protein [Streptomyces griseomycini]MBB4901220.1 para-nitrobenzyl esterase [Streptomyces griseomycini]GGR23112.1 carboxylic ester hydrolase [Streptomyces griseomycini]